MLAIDRTRSLRSLAHSLLHTPHTADDRLPRLADVVPGPRLGGRWVGVGAVPLAAIRGTASAGWRAADFRPLAGREPSDWGFRWARLHAAAVDGVALPPVQLLRTGADYWVVDGHNRVALARELGQAWIDADVTELEVRSDATPSTRPASPAVAAAPVVAGA
jgi:hypothetical protein